MERPALDGHQASRHIPLHRLVLRRPEQPVLPDGYKLRRRWRQVKEHRPRPDLERALLARDEGREPRRHPGGVLRVGPPVRGHRPAPHYHHPGQALERRHLEVDQDNQPLTALTRHQDLITPLTTRPGAIAPVVAANSVTLAAGITRPLSHPRCRRWPLVQPAEDLLCTAISRHSSPQLSRQIEPYLRGLVAGCQGWSVWRF